MCIDKPETYEFVSNENNILQGTRPNHKRIQLLVVFSVIWTTIVCLGMDYWRRWRELVNVNLDVAVGILITNLMFEQAGLRDHFSLSNSELGLPENYPPKRTAGAG